MYGAGPKWTYIATTQFQSNWNKMYIKFMAITFEFLAIKNFPLFWHFPVCLRFQKWLASIFWVIAIRQNTENWFPHTSFTLLIEKGSDYICWIQFLWLKHGSDITILLFDKLLKCFGPVLPTKLIHYKKWISATIFYSEYLQSWS